VAVTLSAELVAVSVKGERLIDAESFFRGAMETALEPDELLSEARLPLLPGDTRFGFAEFSRRAGDYAQAMALAVLHLDGAAIAAPRIGLGGVEATPRLIAAAEEILLGEVPGPEVFRAAAAAAAAAVEPLEDPQTDAQYRRELAEAMVYRALMRAGPPGEASA
jgi:carbon-monoxide dehydrogenase medium subunit